VDHLQPPDLRVLPSYDPQLPFRPWFREGKVMNGLIKQHDFTYHVPGQQVVSEGFIRITHQKILCGKKNISLLQRLQSRIKCRWTRDVGIELVFRLIKHRLASVVVQLDFLSAAMKLNVQLVGPLYRGFTHMKQSNDLPVAAEVFPTDEHLERKAL